MGTYGVVDGEPREIFKDPVTDGGMKKSAKGLLMVEKDADGTLKLADQVTVEQEKAGQLVPVFNNGQLLVDQTLAGIRKRVMELV
jgi:nicotinamide phosphoribosyltransferase